MTKREIKRVERKRIRIRSKLFGTPERPRLAIRKTNKFLYAQLVDDFNKKILAQKSTMTKELAKSGKSAKNLGHAKKLGAEIAVTAKQLGIQQVVFDRGVFIYHGKVKAIADAAREGGLKF
jgi:large subunit ribosomal protein L18